MLLNSKIEKVMNNTNKKQLREIARTNKKQVNKLIISFI